MPYYEYKCEKCGRVTTQQRSMVDRKKPTKCEKCAGNMYNIISNFNFNIKIK